MRAVYLKSTKSPMLRRGGFKLRYDYDREMNVFSQKPDPEEYSEYQEDSFCVNSDEDESGTTFVLHFRFVPFPATMQQRAESCTCRR